MKQSIFKNVDMLLMGFSTSFALNDIESVLSIIILSINVIWVLTRLIIGIYDKVKNNKLSALSEDVKLALESLNSLKEEVKELESIDPAIARKAARNDVRRDQ